MTGTELAQAALALVGCRFRLHGRDPSTGLDCVGVLHAALARCGHTAPLPDTYTLRLRDPAPWLPDPQACGFRPAAPPHAPGDAVLVQVGPAQVHLALCAPDRGWIHAHAGLRRVVHQADLPAGTVIHHWRPAPSL